MVKGLTLGMTRVSNSFLGRLVCVSLAFGNVIAVKSARVLNQESNCEIYAEFDRNFHGIVERQE
jgi:hypothetical protein